MRARAFVARGALALFHFLGGPLFADYSLPNYQIVTSSGVGPQHPTCPGTMKVVGGGAGSSSLLFGSRPEIDGSAWYASAGATAFITAYAICADVDSSYQIVTSSGVVPQLTSCPAGKKVMGGGADSTVQLFGSRPEPPGNAWYASAGPGSAFLTSYAICASVDSSYEIVSSSGVVPQIPLCSGTKIATGGGLDAGVQMYASQPEMPGTGWYGSVGPGGNFLTTYAICMTSPFASEAHNLLFAKNGGSVLDFSYIPACWATDHTLYWGTGPIAGSLVWKNSKCFLGTTSPLEFDPGDPPPGAFYYFVIVGRVTANEGSYGTNGAGVERPEAVAIGACDPPQVIGPQCP